MTDEELTRKLLMAEVAAKAQAAVLAALPGMKRKARTDPEARRAVRAIEKALRAGDREHPALIADPPDDD